MGEIKTFKIEGRIKKGLSLLTFKKEIRALKLEHALEKIYSEFGSRHKVKRNEIDILNIEESDRFVSTSS